MYVVVNGIAPFVLYVRAIDLTINRGLLKISIFICVRFANDMILSFRNALITFEILGNYLLCGCYIKQSSCGCTSVQPNFTAGYFVSVMKHFDFPYVQHEKL